MNNLIFFSLLKASNIPLPTQEYKFSPSRKWRFDYCWPAQKIAVEIEGGAFTNGRHTRGKGFINDMEKYNAAVLHGWALLRFTPQQALQQKSIDTIKQLISEKL